MGRSLLEPVPAIDGNADISALAEFRITRVDNQSIMYVTTEDGQRLAAHIRYLDEAAWVHHEASQNAAAMVIQTRQQNDLGARQIAAMIRRGAHPDIKHSHVTYDPLTGDYGYLLQFPKRAPVPLLLSEAEMDLIRVKQWVARNRASR